MQVISPTLGRIELTEMLRIMTDFILDAPDSQYKLVIGTDSQTHRHSTTFVTAMILHRVGQGARFFFVRKRQKPILDLRHRIYVETQKSLKLLEELRAQELFLRFAHLPVEIHLDIGHQGDTRQVIQEVVGWVNSVGYVAKIKPNSYGASTVADRFTKT